MRDAVLTVPTLETPAHLSLAPCSQRGWGSVYDALNCRDDGSGTAGLERLVRRWRPPHGTHRRLGMPSTRVSGRAVMRKPARIAATTTIPPAIPPTIPHQPFPGQPMVAGWNYSWLVQVPRALLQLDRAPARPAPHSWGDMSTVWPLSRSAPGWSTWSSCPPARGPIFTCDAGYDLIPCNSASPWMICPSASSYVCARDAASTPTRPPSPRPDEDDRGGRGRSLPAMIQRPGRCRPRPGL